MKVNVRLGASLSKTAFIPRRATRLLRDPYTERGGMAGAVAALALVAVVAVLAWQSNPARPPTAAVATAHVARPRQLSRRRPQHRRGNARFRHQASIRKRSTASLFHARPDPAASLGMAKPPRIWSGAWSSGSAQSTYSSQCAVGVAAIRWARHLGEQVRGHRDLVRQSASAAAPIQPETPPMRSARASRSRTHRAARLWPCLGSGEVLAELERRRTSDRRAGVARVVVWRTGSSIH